MGAFLLAKHNDSGFNAAAAVKVFETMGLRSPDEFILGDRKLWSWKKMRSDEPHFVTRDTALLVCAGTPVYKQTATITESLGRIMDDLQQGNFNYRNIRGSYALVYSPDGKNIQLLTDQAGISNVYFDTDVKIISSSFLAVVHGLTKKLTLNKLAATEVITSGRQIGPDTLFNEIQRMEITLMDSIGEVKLVKDPALLSLPDMNVPGFDACVTEQVEEIDSFFKDVQQFGEYYGVDSGLTAGHDSRMMLIQVRKYFKNFQIHSFWRKVKDLELTIAEKVADKAGLKLRVIEGKHELDKTEEQLKDTLKKSLYFYDGHIRMHCFLMEDYHTIEHRTAILGDKKLGINGIGGEQYRNEWHMELPSWSLDYFTRYGMVYQLAGQCFTSKEAEENYLKYLSAKLLRKLGLNADTKRLSKLDIQKYYNEVYVASLMGVRTNAENALGHFLTPFIDRQLTRASYRSLKHHGISFGFQQAMIRKMDAILASVVSGYGYSFTQGEPLKKKLKYLVKEFTPKNIYQDKLNKKFAAAGNKYFRQYLDKYSIFKESVEYLHGFRLPVDEKTVTSRPDIMPVYLSLAYFLYMLSTENRLEVNQG